MIIRHSIASSKIVKAVALSTAVLLPLVGALGCGGGGSPAPSTGSAAEPSVPGDTPAPAGGTPSNGTPSSGTPAGTPGGGAPSGGTPQSGNAPAPSSGGVHAHRRCGWIGADTAAAGTAAFVANADYFDAVHPKWFTLNPDGTPRAIAFTDDATVTDTARTHHVLLIPLIDSDTPDYLRTILSSPQNIQAHAQALAQLAAQHNYDGLELDYEHLWSAADRAPFLALVAAASAALHAEGKVLTLALPAMDHDDGNNAYDYTQLQNSADVMHLMAYDFHYLGGDHLGPLAPKGWVAAVVARVASLGQPGKFVLGVANDGIGNGWYGSTADVIARCQSGTYSTVTDHMQTCSYGPREAGVSPHCTTSQGDAWFEDASSVGEKVGLAKAQGFGGIGYWTLGGEPGGFFDAIKAAYPKQ
ncbi:MAG TPA: glycosyl hydrolase family 18 protein [Polyangia bacterium]|nr:glycosyl hydrolase family 18 protein [Polyangia bacterium]